MTPNHNRSDVPASRASDSATSGLASSEFDLLAVWGRALGESSDPELGFLENGGDSFQAMRVVEEVLESTGYELDFADVLDATSFEHLQQLVADLKVVRTSIPSTAKQ